MSDKQNIFCTNCGSRVQQSSGKARTICPYCGNFFQRKLSCQEDNIQVLNLQKQPKSSKSLNGINSKSPKNSRDQKERFSWFKLRRKSSSSQKLPNLSETRMIKTGGLSPRPDFKSVDNTKKISVKSTIDLQKTIIENVSNAEWDKMCQNVKEIFLTLRSLFFHFHHPHRNSDIQINKIQQIYNCLSDMPKQYQIHIVETIGKSLANLNLSKISNEEILALVMLLMNPLFDDSDSYSVFIMLIITFNSIKKKKEQSNIIILLQRLPQLNFRSIVQRTQNLLSHTLCVRRHSNQQNTLTNNHHMEKWKLHSTKFLALLNVVNNTNRNALNLPLDYTEFYNYSLDTENLAKYYSLWIDSTKFSSQLQQPPTEFSYCQYPCVLSINAKKIILQYESESQMVILAKQTFIKSMRNNQLPNLELAFLNLEVRRDHLVLDSVNEILAKKDDLKKKLKVKFIGEPGLDMGGLTKEWFLLLLRQILYSRASVFHYDTKYRLNWFLNIPKSREYTEFYLTGVLMGLAVYNSINLDVRFPLICYTKLLSPPVANINGHSNVPTKQVGYCPVSLNDLATVYPDLTSGLRELMAYEGDVEQDIGATFEVTYENYAKESINYSLKPNGSQIPVTNKNRQEYVNLYSNFLLNTLIQSEFQAFYHGFHTVCESNALKLLRPEEVEILVCGSPVFDITELKKVVVYDGYLKSDKTIVLFWDVLFGLSQSLQKLFLHFTTGSDRIPVGGVQYMQLKISKACNRKRLPMAYTCFNQLLLPDYRDKNEMKLKLLIAMENSEGFGLK